MKARIAQKVLLRACLKGPFNYKKTTIAKATRKIRKIDISVQDAWLSVACTFVLFQKEWLREYIQGDNMEPAS